MLGQLVVVMGFVEYSAQLLSAACDASLATQVWVSDTIESPHFVGHSPGVLAQWYLTID